MEDYNQLLQEIESTGNSYDPQISIQHIDENPSKKTSSNALDTIKIGENIYYIDYTTQIEDAFDNTDDGVIRLKQGDYIKIDVVNTNETVYQMIQRSLYGISGGNIGRISGEHTGLIIESTEGKMATY